MGDLDLIRNNMLSHYPLGQVSGTRVDFIGANDLTDVNTVGQAAGKIGNAASFVSANTEYLTISAPASLSFGDEDFTIAGWFFLQSKATNMSFVSKFDFTGNDREYLVNYNTAADRFQFSVSANGAAQSVLSANNFGAVPTGQFIFVVAWHDSVANTINIQVNDGTVNSASFSTGVNAGNSPFRISNLGTTSPVQLIDGRADEVTVWGRVLSAAERTAVFNGTSGVDLTSQFFSFSLAADADFAASLGISGALFTSNFQADANLTQVFSTNLENITGNLVSYHRLIEAAGSTRPDSILSTGNDAAEVVSSVAQAAGIVPNSGANSADFDGAGEYLSKSSPSGLNTGAGSFTIGFWARIDGSLTTNMGGVSKFTPVGNQRQFIVFFFGASSQTWRFGVSSDGSDDFGINEDGTITSTGELHQVFAWYDGSADTINIQMDVETVQTVAGPTGVFAGTAGYDIGRADLGVEAVFNGPIQDVCFWDRVLSADERSGFFNSANGIDMHAYVFELVAANLNSTADFTASLSVTGDKNFQVSLQADADFSQALGVERPLAHALQADANFAQALGVERTLAYVLQADADFTQALTIDLAPTVNLAFTLTADADFFARLSVDEVFFNLGFEADANFGALLIRSISFTTSLEADAEFAARFTATDFFAFFDPETTALTSQMG